MKCDWAIHRLLTTALAVLAVTAFCGSAQMDRDGVSRLTIAPATAENPRNSESDVVPLRDGRLLLGWTQFYGGSGADDGAARIVGCISTDGGLTWGERSTLVQNDGKCNVMEVSFVRLRSGGIALFHLQKNAEVSPTASGDCRVVMRVSTDEGKTFGPARPLTGGGRYIETASGRGLMLKSGRILIECEDLHSSFCLISDDDGATWHEGGKARPAGGDCYEPATVELKDGRALMLLRTGLGGQYQTLSGDGGESWSEPTLTALRGTAAPVSLERIPTTGDLLAIWNHDVGSPRARNPLTAAVSRDEGRTWEHLRDIENAPDDAFAYPSVTLAGDVALVTYFGYKGGISLFLKRIPLDWFYR